MPRISWYRGYGPFLIYFIMISGIISAILALIGTAIGVGVSYDSQQKTNQANLKAQEEANKTNLELADKTNQTNIQIAKDLTNFQASQAEKAYNRSTPNNQIRELIAAGYTEQQAKQIIAGSGSAATYTAPAGVSSSAVSPTVSPELTQANLLDSNLLGSMLGNFGSAIGSIGDDLTASDGGSIGKFQAQPLIRECFKHIDEIDPLALSSIKSFSEWFNKYSYKDWIKDNYSLFEKVMSSPQASRAFMAQINDIFNSYSNTQKFISDDITIKHMNLTYSIDVLRKQLLEGEIDQQAIETEMMRYDLKIKPFEYKAVIMELSNRFEVANRDNQYLTNPEYKRHFLRNVLLNEKHRTIWLECQVLHDNLSKMTLQEQADYMAKHKAMFAVYGLFDEYGMTSTDVGSFIAAISAAGIDLTKVVNDMVDVIVGDEEDGNVVVKLDKYIENNKANDAARAYERGEYDKVPGLTKKSGHKGAKFGRRVE